MGAKKEVGNEEGGKAGTRVHTQDENQHEDDDVDEVEAEDKLAASYESMLSHMGWVMPKLQRRKLRRLRLKG